jgi:nicotinamidase-related amidase
LPLSTLDPQCALIVIDLQAGIAQRFGDVELEEVVASTAGLARTFRAHNRPVILVNVDAGAPGRTEAGRRIGTLPPEALEILPELEPAENDIRVTKHTWGAFHGTGLDDELRARGVTQVVISGVATSAGVESTARAAHEHGYHVVLATDAMADRDPQAHRHSIERIFPRLGETASSAEIIAAAQLAR